MTTLKPVFASTLPQLQAARTLAPSAPNSETARPTDSVELNNGQPPISSNNPRELGEKQFADSHGRVTNLALMLSSYASGQTRTQMLEAYKTLFTRTEPDTKFTIAVGSSRDRADVEKMMQQTTSPTRAAEFSSSSRNAAA